MGIRCVAGRHAAAPGEVRNQGFDFSRCRRCGRDMVRTSNRWRLVPRGFRVVWKRGPDHAVLSARQFLLDLPATGRSLVLAPGMMRRSPFDLLLLGLIGLRYLMWSAGERVRAWQRRRHATLGGQNSVIYMAPCAASGTGGPSS